MLAHPCPLARCKMFFGHARQPGGVPYLMLEPEAVIEVDGWPIESGIVSHPRLAQTQMALFMAASRGQWPEALPMKDAGREPCVSCVWPRISMGHNCDDNAAWQGTPPRDVQPGVAAMMVRE